MTDPRNYNPEPYPPHDEYAYGPADGPPIPPAPKKKMPGWAKALIILGACFIGFISCTALVAKDMSTKDEPGTTSTYDPGINTPAPKSSTPKTSPSVVTRGPKLSVSQQNAIKSAESYLNMGGYSKVSLITQLKFEGFPSKEAIYAVGHVTVNWNQEAAESAASYMNTGAFSHNSLTQQLLYEGFTKAQAAFGVKSVGL